MRLYNLSEAGREIGIGRNTLCKMLRKAGIFGKGNTVEKYSNSYFVMQTVRRNNKPFLMPLVTEQGLEYLKNNSEKLISIQPPNTTQPQNTKSTMKLDDDDLVVCLTKLFYIKGCFCPVNVILKWGTKQAEEHPRCLFQRWGDLKSEEFDHFILLI